MRAALPPATLLLACLMLAGCGLPRDPGGTLEDVRGGVLRAGLTPDTDPVLVEVFADRLGARLETRSGDVHDLVAALERGELDLVASLPISTPFKKIGRSRPYAAPGEDRVWAVRPGENAFLLEANRHLAAEAP